MTVEWCPKCHAMLSPGTEKCPGCGARLKKQGMTDGWFDKRDIFWMSLYMIGLVAIPIVLFVVIALLCSTAGS